MDQWVANCAKRSQLWFDLERYRGDPVVDVHDSRGDAKLLADQLRQMDNLNVDRAILIERSRLRMPESGMNGPWHGKGSQQSFGDCS